MEERISLWHGLMLTGYAAGLAAGQVMFKLAARRWPASGTLGEKSLALALNPWLVGAVALYAALSLLWVWILGRVPLTRAYPFVIVAFGLTMLAGTVLFDEPFSLRLMLGTLLIVAGLCVIVG